MDFRRDDPPEYGTLHRVEPLVRRVMARNPGPFTLHGTGTFIVGDRRVAVIDPGPDLPEHLTALEAALDGLEVTHIVVTHTHRDHSPAARHLHDLTGAPRYAYGPHGAGRIERGVQVEEGADHDFAPDVAVRDGDVITGDGWSLEAVHTPGHTANHVCYQIRETGTLLCGDHVMGWNTTIISPPDGDMGQYLASLARLLERDDRRYLPTHGPAIESPKPFVRGYITHRKLRERQVLGCLADGVRRVSDMVGRIYRDLPERMHGAAARQLLATIIHLVDRGEVVCEGVLGLDAEYRLP